MAKVQVWRFTSGPDLSNRGLFYKAALPSPNVEKCDQDGSVWLRVPYAPKTALGGKSSSLVIHAGPDLSNRGLFFKTALPSPNVDKCDQDGSPWVRVPRPCKTALGGKSSSLAIHVRSDPVEQRPFFQSCSA